MNYYSYIDCLEASLPSTGEFQVFYDFSSGIKNFPTTTADFLYNLKYDTGDHTKEVDIGGTLKQVVESKLLPGFSIGQTEMPITHLGYFSGIDLVRVGLGIDFYSGWSATLDITPDLCNYTDQDNLSRVLFSTMDSYNSTSGLHVGINQANKLYIQYNDGNTRPAKTLNAEINKNSVVNISQSQASLTIGVYDLEEEVLERETISSPGYILSDQMYLGGFLSNTNVDYTGYEGFINNFALSDTEYLDTEAAAVCRCMFSTGVEVASVVSQITTPNITGFEEEIQYTIGITGYVEQYKAIPDADGEGNALTAYMSGVTGLIENGTVVNFLTGDPSVASNTTNLTGVLYDSDKLDLYNRYFLNFKNGLKSGEYIEIFSFNEPRNDIHLGLNEEAKVTGISGLRLYNYGLYNQNATDPTVMTRGRNQEPENLATVGAGHDYDYSVLEDQTLSGFITNDYGKVYYNALGHRILYDIVEENALCIDFSGHWETHKVVTGQGVYFPPAPQFYNMVNTTNEPDVDQGQVIITGISGQKIWEDRHIYFNGQKLIENIDYFIDTYTTDLGGSNEVVWPALIITGGMGGFFTTSNSYAGLIGSSVESIWSPEMCFVPKVSGEHPQEQLKFVTGNMDGISDPLSGFSEMIWLNGIRLERSVDYKKGRECSLTKSFTFFGENPFLFYNNSEGFVNFN